MVDFVISIASISIIIIIFLPSPFLQFWFTPCFSHIHYHAEVVPELCPNLLCTWI